MVCCCDRFVCACALRVVAVGAALAGCGLVALALWIWIDGPDAYADAVTGLPGLENVEASVKAAANYPLYFAIAGGVVAAFQIVSACCVGRQLEKCWFCFAIPVMVLTAGALGVLAVGLKVAGDSIDADGGPGAEPAFDVFGLNVTGQLDRAWRGLVDSDPRTACGIETGMKCAGFYNGQCTMPDASFRDREAFAGNLAYCPGQATLVEELPPTGTITAFAESWAWDLEGCLRAEATYVDTGCYALVTEVVDEVSTRGLPGGAED